MTQLSVEETFKERLTSSVKESFMSLIPDEVLTDLTNAALEEFIEGPREKRFKREPHWDSSKQTNVLIDVPNPAYNAFNDPATLKGMIYSQIVDLAKAALLKEFNKPEWQSKFDPSGNFIIDVVDQLIKNNADVFVTALMRNILTSTISTTISSLRNANSSLPFAQF